MDLSTIRETFLRFYEERGHRRYPSASLIPNDPTLLLTIAGMVPFKPYLMGDAVPPSPRATSVQKSVRTNDIDNVGKTTRHMTFFEMLGNFSFGDYFKREAIAWAWELSTEHFGLDPARIWASIYEHDDEAAQLWLAETDVPEDRVVRMGMADNYWDMGTAGPCGPCAELHYDRGEAWGEAGGPAVNGERYIEYYNLVFMQYERDDDFNILGELPQRNVDTGMGLERAAAILQGVPTVFDTDAFMPLIERASQVTGASYSGRFDPGMTDDVSLRVLAEHARSCAFLIADGVLPSKDGRGYVLRRLLRRAVRHANLLGHDLDSGSVLRPMVDAVIATMSGAYPELQRQRELITRIAVAEEADFAARIRQGLTMVDETIAAVRAGAGDAIPGDVAFRLHDTFGFPVDLTAEIAEDAGLSLDRAEFERLMAGQRDRARAAAKRGAGGIPPEVYRAAAGTVGTTDFLGYDVLIAEAQLGAIVTPAGLSHDASEGDEVEIVLARTPFYAEGGGQVGDRGLLVTPTGRLEVVDTHEAIEGVTVHRSRVVAGEVTQGQPVHATVDPVRRAATARSHSATHVLHATVKEELGSHAQQAGSLVAPGRLRFDFPHFEQVARERLRQIEATINDRVLADPFVTTEVMDLEAARAAGAVANFGDKYGQVVRVVTIGDFSKELCGGTHVDSGAHIGTIAIVREESIGSNTRRVEALTGMDAFAHVSRERVVAEEVARLLDVATDQAVARVADLLGRLRDADRELTRVRSAGLAQQAARIAGEAVRQDGGAVVTRAVDGLAMDDLRQLANEVRGQLATRAIVVLGSTTADGRAQLIAAVTPDLASAGIEARPILHPAAQVVGGGAGGKGDLAQAGGRDGDKLADALDVAAREAREVIGQTAA